jgi:hypothetical protein
MDMEPEPQIQNGDFTLAFPTSSGRFTKEIWRKKKTSLFVSSLVSYYSPKKKPWVWVKIRYLNNWMVNTKLD